ncbi:hypothetical protein KUTeg_017486 [Tegillarca granosa]|uniref:SSD domain-containing protein n=1 Tax=Tegillarca granosa TaxID=220873 RepID=A0ABQ9EF17_TEGGR|nr:hypothetical protein KUTeg_017486 [Tegillarca granosa]
MMVSRLFQVHGHFCAAHPWEVIIGTFTVTMCLMSMHMFTGSDQACGWKSYACSSEKTVSGSDVIILSVTKCLSVMYIYLQFRNLRNLESKYLIEALPFFLLLIDLTKSCALARFALRASSQEDIQNSIGKGMAQLGPAFTLDAIVEVLVIGLGTLSVNADYTLTLVLAVFLTAKYMFLEEDAADILKSNSEDTLTGEEREISSENTYKDSRQVKFVLGETDSSSVSGSDEEETEVHEIEQSNKKCFDEIGTQTEWGNSKSGDSLCNEIQPERSKEECIQIMKSDIGPSALTDKEIVGLVRSKHIPAYKLEDMLGDCERGVSIRRQILASDIDNFEVLEKLPYTQYDYDIVNGACCENVIGYIPVPVGIAGPLLLDGEKMLYPHGNH